MNIACWLERAAASEGDRAALAVGERVCLTYEGLLRRSAGLASTLRRAGLAPGDRVAIAAKNHAAYLEVLFAAWWAGLVAVPINAKLHPAEMAWIIGHAQARAVFVSEDLAPGIGALQLEGVRVVVSLGGDEYERLVSVAPTKLVPRAGDDVAWLFYTSGTTGRPKGAMLTHRNLTAMSLSHLVDVDRTARGDALLHCAPMSHGSGMLALPHVCARGINVIPESGGFATDETFALIGRWPSSSFFAAPTMVRRLVEAAGDVDLSTLRTIVWGGAPMLVPDMLRALDRFGPRLAQIYGQGESPMTISALPKEELVGSVHSIEERRLASAGTARSVVVLRVGDDEVEATPGEMGEVLVRGDTVMAGYWGNPEATAAVLQGGWLHTGDMGTVDEHGYLTLIDRSRDLIISGGTNVYPREVEEVLVSHPNVREVSVIGRPDPEWGEVVVAYVVGDASAEELDRLCLDSIARFKRPKDYVFLSELPKNNYGKILKTELRSRDSSRPAALEAAKR